MYQGVFSLKRRIEIIMAVVLLAAAAVIAPRSARYVMNMKAEMAETCICIDAGHGGDDPGKVGTQGTKEKEINLQIAIKLKKRLEKEGMKDVEECKLTHIYYIVQAHVHVDQRRPHKQ